MILKMGSRLGPYEIAAPLGVGGMGEVYRAHDPRLARPVAIKILSPNFSADPDRLRRFEQEARAASRLNHPAILAIYDVGQHERTPYLVSELLEGETLRQRLARERVSLRRALDLALQLASGLAAAHDRGIVHRDLKPENIFLTRDGHVKILDFGLAKLARDDDDVTAESATRTQATRPGVILGSAGYMSPEQARGQEVDHRTDIFSFGAVLYEMLSGRQAFRGETSADTITAILKEDPAALCEIAPRVPAAIDRLVTHCLEKNAEHRFHSMRDLAFDLEGALSTLAISRGGRRLWRFLASALGIVFFAVLVISLLRHKPTSEPNTLTIVPFTTYRGTEQYPSFSPDGNQIAFAWNGGEDASSDALDLYVKQIGSEIPRRLTNRPASYLVPAWSPDGRLIAFSRSSKNVDGIYIVPALGGPERKLVDTGFSRWVSGILSWSPDAKWLAFADAAKPVIRVPPLTNIHLLNVETLERRVLPQPSPECSSASLPAFSSDGKSLAFACMDAFAGGRIYVQPALTGSAREVARIVSYVEGLAWSADSKSLLYSVDGQLWRIPAAGGKPEKLLFAQNAHAPAVAGKGKRLAYVEVIGGLNIWRLDLASATKPRHEAKKLIASSRGQQAPRISPDAKHIAFESWTSGNMEIWVADSDGANPVQLTSFGGPLTGTPRWSPDSRRIVFDSRASGDTELYIVNADGGPPQRLATGTRSAEEPFWSKDGHWIYFSNERDGGIWKVSAAGGTAVQLSTKLGVAIQESADGMRIFYALQTANGAEVWSASVNGGDERPVTGMSTLLWADQWVPAKNGIYFIDGRSIPPTLNLFDLATRRSQRILELKGTFQEWGTGLSISGDGRTLVYAQNDQSSGDIMLVEGFE